MEIHQHFRNDGTVEYITVTEALPVELISTELFEQPQPWLTIYEFEDTGREVFGSFAIHASNGSWVYKLTRRAWWLNHTYEGKLVLGPVVRHPVHTVAVQVAAST